MKAECCGAYPSYTCDGCPNAKVVVEPAKPDVPAVATGARSREGFINLWAPDMPVGATAIVKRINGHEFSWAIQPLGAKQ